MEKPREARGAVARRRRSRGCVGGEVRGTLRSSTSRHVAPRGGGACRVDSARGASYAFLGTQAKGQVPSARVPRVEGYYDRITVARLMYERTLMSAARLRSRIERRFMSRRFASWSAGAVASASLERRRVRFSTERTRRVAATCVLTWQWLVTASRETRAHAHGAQRDRAVRCVRAWRRHVSDKAERQTRLKKSYANVVKSRAKRTLRVWLRHASLAHAKRMKYMESNVVEA